MNDAASLRAAKVSKIRRLVGAFIAATVFATTSNATTRLAHKQPPRAFSGHGVRGRSGQGRPFVTVYADTMYKQALGYMLEHPPRAYGHGPKVEAENKHLADENRQLYSGMDRLELMMNYLAATCSEIHPVHDAICDGRAMLRLLQIQQRQRAHAGF